ncbi:Glycogen synthase [Mycobacterium talmoniae]|uniref:starch synthase n=1 Tax=Mycobacterium talmoniae TaxID=1858794 RepID=A0A2S8BK08_9MYCO|nr:Glycogen synthase [Mycobacterium talmoniae]
MKILMVSWEYPPVVIGGLGRHVHHLSTALAAAGHDVVVLSRRPTDTDPSTHPSSDEVSEGVRVVAAAQDPHEFSFGPDMMAWTLAMGHSMVRAGLSLKTHGASGSGGPTWCTPTTGWWRTRRSRWPNSTMCHWFPRFTPPKPDGIPAGCPAGSVVRCTRWNPGWSANPIR